MKTGKLICEHGHIFDESELQYRRECVGEFWGMPAYQDIGICPECGTDEWDEYEELEEEEKD